jgi:quinol monooxygenase YgiN
MLVIAGTIDIDKSNWEEAVRLVTEMMHATRNETGCEAYTFSADLEDPGRFHLFERWASEDALEAHFKAPHMAAFQMDAARLGVRATEIVRYAVSSAGPVRA